MKNCKWSIIVAIAALLVTASCSHISEYSSYEPVPVEGWNRQDVRHFSFGPVDSATIYTCQLGLRTTPLYPYTTVTLVVRWERVPSHVVRYDTVTVTITDEDGRQLGDGSRLCHYAAPLPPISTDSGEQLIADISHHMHHDPLPGLSDVGLTLKSNQLYQPFN